MQADPLFVELKHLADDFISPCLIHMCPFFDALKEAGQVVLIFFVFLGGRF